MKCDHSIFMLQIFEMAVETKKRDLFSV